MMSARSLTEDSTFSRPRPARAARRSTHVRGISEETPPPPYDSPSDLEESGSSDGQLHSKHTEPRPHHSGATFHGELFHSFVDHYAYICVAADSSEETEPILRTDSPSEETEPSAHGPNSNVFDTPTVHQSDLSRSTSPKPNIPMLDTSSFVTPPSVRIASLQYHSTSPTITSATPQRVSLLKELNEQLQDRVEALTSQLHEDGASSSARLRKLERELSNLKSELLRVQSRNDELEGISQREFDSGEEERREAARRAKEERNEKLRAARRRRLTHGIALPSWSGRLQDFAPPSGSPSKSKTGVRSISSGPLTSRPPQVTAHPDSSYSGGQPPMGYDFSSFDSPDNLRGSTLVDALKASGQDVFGESSTATSNTLVDSPVQGPILPVLTSNLESSPDSISVSLRASLKKISTPNATLSAKRALGNKKMIAGTAAISKGKGRTRTAITSLSFVPPKSADESISQLALKESVSTSTTARTYKHSTLSRATNLDARTEEPFKFSTLPFNTTKSIPSPIDIPTSPFTALLRKAESLLEDEDPSGPIMSPVISHQRRRNPFLGTAPSETGSPLLRTKTLMSELGSEFGDDWKTNMEQELFNPDDALSAGDGNEMRARITAEPDDYTQQDDEGQNLELMVNDGSMDAMNALAHALDPMRVGDPRASDEHILPVGCLRNAPPETFYLLEKAVAARPAVWIDSCEAGRGGRERNLLVTGLGDGVKLPSARVRDATWNLYPDEDTENGSDGKENEDERKDLMSSFMRREKALNRMDEARQRRISNYGPGGGSVPISKAARTPLPVHPSPFGGNGSDVPRQPLPSGLSDSFFSSRSRPDPSSGQRRAPSEDGSDDDGFSTEGSLRDDDGGDEDEDDDSRSTVGCTSSYPHTSLLTPGKIKAQEEEEEDKNRGQTVLYGPQALAAKIQRSSLHTIMQAWITFQFVAVVATFIYFAAKRGPSAIMAGSSGDGLRVRSSRGVRSRRR